MSKGARIRNGALLGLGLALPFILTNPYLRSLMILVLIYGIFATSFNLVVGYLGEVSFGHSAFLGLGAYISALLMQFAGMSYWATLPLSFLIGSVIACGIGLISFRVSGVHFAICTLAFAEILRLLALNWVSVTGGALGLHTEPIRLLFSTVIMNDIVFYYICFITLALVLFVIARLLRSPIGRSWIAIRESDPLARSIGVNPAATKVTVFALAGGIAAVAGSFYLAYYRVATPQLMSIYYTSLGLLSVIVGGKGSLFGPLIGVVVFTILPEILRLQETNVSLLLFSGTLIVTILFLPKGVVDLRSIFANRHTMRKGG